MKTSGKKKPRYFYGWNVVGASFMAHLAYAEHHSSMLGFFFKPLQSQFGWSRSAIAGVQTIARATEAIIAPFAGPLIDRYGPRVLMPIGAIIVGLGMLAITQVTALWNFYLFRGIIVAVGFTFMGALVTDVAVNNWFIRKRGRALAFSRVGSNISNVIFIPITVFVIAASGWETMFVIFAVVTWLVVLIPSALLMRRRPEDMGLYPDGIDPDSTEEKTGKQDNSPSSETVNPKTEPIWNRKELLKSGSFWLLALCFGIDSMAFQGVNISLAPYIQDLGYDDAMLTGVMSFRAVIMAITLPLMGFLAEHTNKLYIRVTPFAIQGLGAVLFLFADQPVFLWLAVAVYGMGFAGVMVTQEVVWANYFGRLSLGLVRSTAYLLSFGFGAIGPLAMNAAFDVFGSYRPAFVVIAIFFAVAAVLIGMSHPPKPLRFASAEELHQTS